MIQETLTTQVTDQPQTALPGQLHKLELGEFDRMLELMALAFAEDEARDGRNLRSEMQGVRSMLPFLKVLIKVVPGLEDRFYTLVWKIDERFIAVVTISRQGSDKTRWYIFNVATHPDYRGRGLARRMVNAALDRIRARGGQRVLLDVRTDNVPAYQLYRHLGFLPLESTAMLKGRAVRQPRPALPDGYTLRELKDSDWQPHFELARRLASPEMRSVCPPTPDQFQFGAVSRGVNRIINRAQRVSQTGWLIELGNIPVALATCRVQRSLQSPAQLTLTIDPDHEATAKSLIAQAFNFCIDRSDQAEQSVLVHLDQALEQTRDYLRELHFEEIEVDHTLGLSLA
jgi:ribosomal protein S18 acetylase RimI-like enzyme